MVDYVDQNGERHIQTFMRNDYYVTVKVDVRQGIHTAPSKSMTMAQAADYWIKSVQLEAARSRRSPSIASTPSTSRPESATESSPASQPPVSIRSVMNYSPPCQGRWRGK